MGAETNFFVVFILCYANKEEDSYKGDGEED